MANYIKNIINDFETWWLPQTLSVAENVFSCFIAGETLRAVQIDYDLSNSELESAIRFFALHWKRNKSAVELYDNWQEKRFKTEDK